MIPCIMCEECLKMQAGTVVEKQWETSNGQGKKKKTINKKENHKARTGRHLIKAVLFVLAYQARRLSRWLKHMCAAMANYCGSGKFMLCSC